jgi:Icc-related predicted phosphoesterase
MLLHIISDLHLESGTFKMSNSQCEVLILAGDIGIGMQGLRWLKSMVQVEHVLYVPGNHEYYYNAIPLLTQKMRNSVRKTNNHILADSSVVIEDVEFFGCTLWTDFNLVGDATSARVEARYGINDYSLITCSKGNTKLRPTDTEAFHYKSRQWLANAVRRFPERKRVIITHHAPSARSLSKVSKYDLVHAAYASNMDSLVSEMSPDLWIHGHVHESGDYMLGKTRVVCNPRGYAESPNPDFDPELVIQV